MKFSLLPLALEYCQGQGLEIGGAAHNPYGVNALNIQPVDGYEWHVTEQRKLGNEPLPVDIWAEGDQLPVDDSSQDFVLASHVIEHMPDAIRAILEWFRVIRTGGVLFLVLPQRDALEADRIRPLTTLEHCKSDYRCRMTVKDHPIADGHAVRGHYHVWDLDRFLELVYYVRNRYAHNLAILKTQDPDQKVGNGFAVVLGKS